MVSQRRTILRASWVERAVSGGMQMVTFLRVAAVALTVTVTVAAPPAV
jgi:hypothetical protein